MDLERWEKITAPLDQVIEASPEDARLRETWRALNQDLASSPPPAAALDPDDVFAEVARRERVRRCQFQRRGIAVAASLLLMAVVVGSANWKSHVANHSAQGGVHPVAGVEHDAVPSWEDDWDPSADRLQADLLGGADFFFPPPNEAWIDRQIEQVFQEFVRVGEMH